MLGAFAHNILVKQKHNIKNPLLAEGFFMFDLDNGGIGLSSTASAC